MRSYWRPVRVWRGLRGFTEAPVMNVTNYGVLQSQELPGRRAFPVKKRGASLVFKYTSGLQELDCTFALSKPFWSPNVEAGPRPVAPQERSDGGATGGRGDTIVRSGSSAHRPAQREASLAYTGFFVQRKTSSPMS